MNLDYCSIRSPIDGRAGLRQVDVGNTVTAGSNGGGGGAVLVQIDNFDPIYTDFTVAEPDIPLVRRYLGGPNAEGADRCRERQSSAARGQPLFHGQHSATRDRDRCRPARSRPTRTTPSGRHSLSSVRLILDTLKDAKLVPNGAVQIGQNGPYIFVVKKDSTLDLRQVKPGQKQDDNLTVIEEGVQPGETVVVRGQLQLAPGTKVVVKEEKTSPNEAGGDRRETRP